MFDAYDFELIEIDDIESEDSLTITEPETAEKLELFEVIQKKRVEFVWGQFHTYDEESE